MLAREIRPAGDCLGRVGPDRWVTVNPTTDEGAPMKLSTRNQLAGKVTDVKLGTIMSEITVDVGGQTITAAITRASTDELALASGDDVTVLIKATEVMLGK